MEIPEPPAGSRIQVEENASGFSLSWDYPRRKLTRPVFGILAVLNICIIAIPVISFSFKPSNYDIRIFAFAGVILVPALFTMLYYAFLQFRAYEPEKLTFTDNSVIWLEGSRSIDRLLIETSISKLQINFLNYLFSKSREITFSAADNITVCKSAGRKMLALGNEHVACFSGKALVPQEKEFLLAVFNVWKNNRDYK
ncbi:hypothetical protein P0136_05495 [Lentisphaerota bacterium ZTH]|nr:hypothetical protein JYG24_03390 [Lentisphaerota bacterium]WET07445.1 hypothetical protein P0136_05495 [Lentisphaerota bacterium ZTH]